MPTPAGWPRRRAGLAAGELALHNALLLTLRAEGVVTRDHVDALAAASGVDAGLARRRLEERDLARFSEQGDVVVAYPFSSRPTPHLLEFDDGRRINAMCAVDGLGVSAMLRENVVIRSSDPLDGAAILVETTPDGRPRATPREAVVFVGGGRGGSAAICCSVTNFFSSRETAEAFARANTNLAGSILSVADAAEAGRGIFGEALR